MEEPKALGDWNNKCKSKLYTDTSKEGVSVPFLYQCGQSWKPVACMSHTATKTVSACSDREGSFGPSPQV